MIQWSSMIIMGFGLFIVVVYGQSWNDTNSTENVTESIVSPKPFVYFGRYHRRRFRRETPSKISTSNLDTGSTILSILPLDRLGALIGQIMSTGLKEMLNPDVGKKIVNIIENQAPSLLTSLLTNLYSTLRVPTRSSTNRTNNSNTKTPSKQLSNHSLFSSINSKRQPRIK